MVLNMARSHAGGGIGILFIADASPGSKTIGCRFGLGALIVLVINRALDLLDVWVAVWNWPFRAGIHLAHDPAADRRNPITGLDRAAYMNGIFIYSLWNAV